MSKVNMQEFHPRGQDFAIDPVCGMKADSQNPPFQILVPKKNYYFARRLAGFCLSENRGNISKAISDHAWHVGPP